MADRTRFMSCFSIKESLFNKYKSSLYVNIGDYNEFKQLYFQEYHNKKFEVAGDVYYSTSLGDYYCHIIVDGSDHRYILASFLKYFTMSKNHIMLNDDLFNL